MKQRRFKMVDVFAVEAYLGNPLAVVVDAEGLSGEEMQRFACWMNLSETAFLLPPSSSQADYRLRIFTPVRELPFAGHPTLGSCHAWLEAGGRTHDPTVVVQECPAGLVTIRSGRGEHTGQLSFAAPPLVRTGPVEPELLAEIARVLRISPSEILHHQWVDNGPGWVAVMLRSAEAVLTLEPDLGTMSDLELGVVGAYPDGGDAQFELRALISKGTSSPYEDPVTGSLNASVAGWLIGAGLAPERYRASQGTRLGRSGRVYLERDPQGQVWVGGRTVTCVDGQVLL